MPDIAETRCTAAELGRVLKLTGARIRQLATAGTLARDDDGKYALGEAVQSFLAYKVGAVTGDAADWKLRRLRAQALLAEHEAHQAQQVQNDPLQIWPRVQSVIGAHARRLWDGLAALAPLLVGLPEPYQTHRVLEDWARPLLERLATEAEDHLPAEALAPLRAEQARDAAALDALRAADAQRKQERDHHAYPD